MEVILLHLFKPLSSMLDYYRKLNALLTRKDKRFIILLMFLSIVLSAIETIGISAIMPFIAVASKPALIETNKYYKAAYTFFDFNDSTSFIMAFGLALVGFYVFRSVYNMFYTYALNRFSFGRFNYFAQRLFEKYVTLSCRELFNRNSSMLTQRIVSESSNLSAFVQQSIYLLAEIFTAFFIYIFLLLVNLKITIVFTVFLMLLAVLLTRTTSKLMKKQSVKLNIFHSTAFKIMGETFGNFKLIKLLGNENQIREEFGRNFGSYAKGFLANATLVALPRNILEAMGFSLLLMTIIFFTYRNNDVTLILPVISLYALALYRMLPSVNRILTSYNQISFHSNALNIIHEDLSFKTEEELDENIGFKEKIEARDVTFSYDGKKEVLKKINISIPKGSKVAFIGESGGGKSTLADIIIGIHKPESGLVLVDDTILSNRNVRAWRKKVGYIPQSIYLFDGTVAQNVAFGKDFYKEKVVNALKKANIYDFLLQKEGIETIVGEGGIKLSVGQKQRIGIARALYDDPEFLVLDEATSALDTKTENRIMSEIFEVSEDKTLLIIAHRLSTTERCDAIYALQNGILKKNELLDATVLQL